ncbi:MAG: hypothetical protein KTR25_09930, partial [Myxococcales bacterium]|nr:hypothetical protein [Myxococcales bacterium]
MALLSLGLRSSPRSSTTQAISALVSKEAYPTVANPALWSNQRMIHYTDWRSGAIVGQRTIT